MLSKNDFTLIKRLIFVILLTWLVPCLTLAQNRKLKSWKKSPPLIWTDYLGACTDTSFDAYTCTGDTIFFEWDNNSRLRFYGYALMDKKRSWVKDGQKNDWLLKHEQIHFDIAEYFFKQLLKILNSYRFSKNFESEILNLQHIEIRERQRMQILYDNQTQHSKLASAQNQWKVFVKELLEKEPTIPEAISKEPGSR